MRCAIAALFVSANAYAGACPWGRLRVEVRDGAPTNVEVRFTFESETVEVREVGAGGAILKEAPASARDATLTLRANGAVVPVTLRRELGAAHPRWLARPVKDLAPHTAYTVSVADVDVVRFVTGDGPDHDAPKLAGAKATVYGWPWARDWKDPSGTFAELALDGLEGATGVEVYDDPDARELRWFGEQPRFGSISECGTATYSMATHPIWVRAYDAAGNVSPLREVDLDARRPKRRRR